MNDSAAAATPSPLRRIAPIWGAADKSGLFTRVFDVEPHFEWKQPHPVA
jgi:hypothetical protein